MIVSVKSRNKKIDAEKILDIAAKCGDVKSFVKFKKCMYLHMPNDDQADRFISKLNNIEMNEDILQARKVMRPLDHKVQLSKQLGLVRVF